MPSKAKDQTPLIQTNKLSKVYRPTDKKGEGLAVKALDEIDLKIYPGEYVAIIGPSGSGKSTLMQVLGLLDRPSSGQILFDGEDISRFSDSQLAYLRNHRIGFIFQFFNLLARTSAVANVALPLIYARHPDPLPKAKKLLETVGMGERLYHAPHQLSGGQQQRVAIARALANDPPLIFADEPTGNISSQHAKEVMDQLDKLNSQGTTIVLVTHDMNVANHAKRIIEVRDGKIVADRINRRSSELETQIKHQKVPGQQFTLPSLDSVVENLRMAMRALSLNKVRTFLTMLGVIIGVAAVISMTAIGSGASQAVKQRLASLGENLFMAFPGNQSANGYGRIPRFTLLDSEGLKQLTRGDSQIAQVDACYRGNVTISYADKSWSTSILGCEPSYESMRASKPVAGRFFTEQENLQRERVCLLGKTVVTNLYPEGFDPTGTIVKINRNNFRVLGVLPTKGASYRDEDDVVVAPLLTVMFRVVGVQTIGYMDIQARSSDQMDVAIEETRDFLRHLRHLGSRQDDDFTIRNLADIQAAQNDTAKTLSVLINCIALLSLGVGGIGIMNIMLVSVRERTKEIGLRKALGAQNSEVLFQFLVESVLIGLIGGLVGIALGSGGAGSAALLAHWPVLLPWGTVIIAVVFSAFTGIIFGIWPAWQASRLSPIEALRYE